jgi:hypothetical protein
MNPYTYQSSKLQANIQLKEATSKWLRYSVDFPTAFPTTYKENRIVLGEYLQPRNVNLAPLVILVHGWGDHSTIPCQLLAKALVKKGIACFILYLVFHSRRMAQAIKQRSPLLTPDEWFEGYQISVTDVRQLIDWASLRPEIDQKKIAVLGISLGGFVSEIAMGVDQRIKAGIFIVGGGNAEVFCWNTKHEAIQEGHTCTEAECRKIRSHYPKYRAEVVEKGLENVTPIKHCFLTDPLTYASFLKNRPIMMINALWDTAVPREATLDFWEACGRPPITWYPATHAGVWLLYPLIANKVAKFLNAAFGM